MLCGILRRGGFSNPFSLHLVYLLFYASFPRVDDSRFELIKIGAKAKGLEPEYHLKNEAWR